MHKTLRLLVSSLFSVSLATTAQASLQSDLDQIIQSSQPPVHIGVVVRQATTGNVLYAREGQSLFSPASIQKLVTATAALIGLGKDFRFQTTLLTNGSLSNGTLNGDVVIKFSGDPELTADHLNQLVAALAARGVRAINGRVWLDTSTYDNVAYPPGWLWDDLSYSYAAPLSAANVNKNRFFLQIVPATQVGAAPTLNSSLPDSVVHFANHIVTTDRYNRDCPLTIYSDLDNHFVLQGCIPKGSQPWGRSLALRNPVPYAAMLIGRYLQAHHISYNGRIGVGKVDARFKAIAIHASVPLSEMLKHMLKKSDNLISNSMMKQLGYQLTQRQGTWINGKAAVQQLLRRHIGVDYGRVLMDDGAGMSRYNLLTPNMLTLILDYIYKQPDDFRLVLINGMPIAGIDGTLRGRMPNLAKARRVHAKTGTMTGVSGLTGFVFSEQLGPLSFAIITNGFIGKGRPYKHMEDRICQRLASYPGSANG